MKTGALLYSALTWYVPELEGRLGMEFDEGTGLYAADPWEPAE